MNLVALLSRSEVDQHRGVVGAVLVDQAGDFFAVLVAGDEHDVVVLHVSVHEPSLCEGDERRHHLREVAGYIAGIGLADRLPGRRNETNAMRPPVSSSSMCVCHMHE